MICCLQTLMNVGYAYSLTLYYVDSATAPGLYLAAVAKVHISFNPLKPKL